MSLHLPRFLGLAAALALVVGALAASPPHPRIKAKTLSAVGTGENGKIAVEQLKAYARAQCSKAFGADRDGFVLADLSCDGRVMNRHIFTCKAKATCDGSRWGSAAGG